MRLLFEPAELLERLAALTPRADRDLLRCMTACWARGRRGGHAGGANCDTPIAGGPGTTTWRRPARPETPLGPRTNWLWAQ